MRDSLEITAPVMPAVPSPRQSRVIDPRGTRRTIMRVMQIKGLGMVAVFEQDPRAGSNGKRVLVFESATGTTRVENFPSEWQRLTEDELTKLRNSAC